MALLDALSITGQAFLNGARVWFALCLLSVWAIAADAATFQAALDRNTIGLGESATLSLTFEGGTPEGIPQIEVPPGLTVQSAGESRKFLMSSGRTTSSLAYNFQVTPSRVGDYVIPSIQVAVGNQTLRSRPLTLRVTQGSTSGGLAFLKLIPSKTNVFVGEVFPVEIQLFLGARQDSLQMPQLEGDGFIFGTPAQPTQSNSQIGNQMYTVGTFRLSAMAVKSGKLTLGPAQCSMVLHIPMAVRNRGFFDDFLGGGVQRKAVTLSSEPQTVTVLPLPTENKPPGFNGAVGRFSIEAGATPTNVAAGDPITLRLQVSGEGNLESLAFPAGTDWPDFKLYQPTSKIESSDPLGISGVKTFERVLIPGTPAVKELPAIALSFFDPERKAYRTVSTAPIPLVVSASQAGPPQPTVLANSISAEEAEPAPRDIVHIKPHLGTVTGAQAPWIVRPWFLAIQVVPLLAWLSAWAWRKRSEKLRNNPRLRRRLFVNDLVRKGLKDLYRFADAQDSDTFFAAVFRLLQEQLGERLDLPASAITEAVIDERLRGAAADELMAELHGLFQNCNQARYAPHRSSQELVNLVPKVESALQQLRQTKVER